MSGETPHLAAILRPLKEKNMDNPLPGDPEYDQTDDHKAAWMALAAASLRGFCNKVAEFYSEPEQQPEYQLASGLAIYMHELAHSELSSSDIDSISEIGEQAFEKAAKEAEARVELALQAMAKAREDRKAAQK
jgi:hypothetical protein